MKKLISHIFVALLLALSISAQEDQLRLFDEFGEMPLGETMARLQNLAIEIGNTPKSKALIRIYGGQKDSFGFPYLRGSVMKAVWGNTLKHPSEKLLIQFCNINKEPIRTKFFIVRENNKVEICEENLTVPMETVLFENIYFYSSKFNLIPLESKVVEYGFADGEYSAYAQKVLQKLLNDSSESKIYIITYLKTEIVTDGNGKILAENKGFDKQSVSKRMIKVLRAELIKNGFSPSQIVMIEGGYVNGSERQSEFWFVPKGGAIPKPKPDYIPIKAK